MYGYILHLNLAWNKSKQINKTKQTEQNCTNLNIIIIRRRFKENYFNYKILITKGNHSQKKKTK